MAADNKKKDAERVRAVKRKLIYGIPRWAWLLGGSAVLAAGLAVEARTSFLQSKIFRSIADGKTFTDTQQTGPKKAPHAAGPYDARLGYTETLKFRERLTARGYDLENEHTWQERSVLGVRLFPIYNEKAQAGLKIQDDTNAVLFEARFPRQAYGDFDSVPPLLVKSLLFVEDRGPLDQHTSTWNPAIDWPRFMKAGLGQVTRKVGLGGDNAGGSTLATQIEKFRHSKGGVTDSAPEKLGQMLTASVRCYQDGTNTADCAQRIVLDYLNSMPLSSYPGQGEVHGFADGMRLWFGADFEEANRLLRRNEADLDDAELRQVAKVYRQSLSLVLAVKKPSSYLLKDRQELEARIDKFLPLLVEQGIISERLKNATLAERVEYPDPARPMTGDAASPKSVKGLQVDLLRTLDVKGLYDLNRLDLTAHTTIDARADREISRILRSLADPDTAEAAGLTGFRLLPNGKSGDVIYSFTLYERAPDGRNLLRVQTDNYNGALNLNEGTKLELGSTAKLRTLVSYLEAMTDLHRKYAGRDSAELSSIRTLPEDNLTRWALNYLSAPETDKSLNAMLEAALDRTYSAGAGEAFFTGGGLHRFENFEGKDNGRTFTVKDAFHNSINLPFIRMMRDITYYTQSNKMQIDPAIFTDTQNPTRIGYLKKFVDEEGRKFMWDFWNDQKDKSPDALAAMLAAETRRTPAHLAVVFRSLHPDAPYEAFDAFARKECGNCDVTEDFRKTFDAYGKDKFNLNDRGYITGIHPLALWLAEYRINNPGATWDQAAQASADVRLETYQWLFKENKKEAQDLRIRIMLEKEAFTHIHKTWKSLGFPFSTMVASYASAIGVSGDTPAALAELAGIIQNDGVRKPSVKFQEIQFGQNTPYEMVFHPKSEPGTRVLPEEITRLVRREMQGVVQEGTARRAYQSVKLSDGRILPVGAKTGTGDNRQQTFTAHGGVKSSEVKSRTATFVFTIDDRFFGCVTAYVEGPSAAQYKFTSGLSAQVFKTLVPAFQHVLDNAYQVEPPVPQPVKKVVQSYKAPPAKPS